MTKPPERQAEINALKAQILDLVMDIQRLEREFTDERGALIAKVRALEESVSNLQAETSP